MTVPVEALPADVANADVSAGSSDIGLMRQREEFENTTGFRRSILQISRQVIRLAADMIVQIRMRPSEHGSTQLEDMNAIKITDSLAALERWREEHAYATWTERTRIGSMAVWNATHIILRYGLLDAPVEDPSVQAAAMDILDLCIQAGDKIEYLNWVSDGVTLG